MSYSELILPNGVKILVDTMQDVGSVSMTIGVGVGSRHENPMNAGVSHFVEHMAFKGTKAMNVKEIAEFFDNLGAQYNAYTSKETTFFYFKVLSEHVDRAVPALLDMVFDATYPDEELLRERGVILEEINESDDDPSDSAYELYMSQTYKDQQLGRPILGYKSTVGAMSRDTIVKLIGEYAGDNVVIALAGNISHEQAVLLLKPVAERLKSKDRIKPEHTEYVGGYAETRRQLEQVQLNFGFPGASIDGKDYERYRLAASILGKGMSSRLFQEVREKRGLAYSISAHNAGYHGCGVFSVMSSTSPMHVAELIKVSLGQISDLAASVTAEELERSKNKIKATIWLSREDSMSRALYACNSHLNYGKYLTMAEIKKRIDDVTIDDVRSVYRELLNSQHKTLIALGGIKDDDNHYMKLMH